MMHTLGLFLVIWSLWFLLIVGITWVIERADAKDRARIADRLDAMQRHPSNHFGRKRG